MAPLPDEWKILDEGEDITFIETEEEVRKRHMHQSKTTHPESETAAEAIVHASGWDNPEFRKRVISAAVLAPVVLAAVIAGGAVFYALVLICAVLMLREWDDMNEHRASSVWGWAGVAYVTATCLSFILLRNESLTLLVYLLAVVWATDIGAYFAGRSIGGPKLAPRISPKKTWAGLFGGMLSAVAVGGILSVFFTFPANIVSAALLSAALAVVAQAGDLFESWMKRVAGIKDSSNLIPGHGGILDRVDGLTFSAPMLVVVYYLWLWSWLPAAETAAQ